MRGIAEDDCPQLSAVNLLVVVEDLPTERRNDLVPRLGMRQICLVSHEVRVDYRCSMSLEKLRHMGLARADAPL